MFTSDIDRNKKKSLKTAFVYLLISLFCIVFGAVYEIFSHEVYSYFMLYAFCFPLIGGTLVYSIWSFSKFPVIPNAVSGNLYHSGIATLTVGSFIRGVLDIYGTTNALTRYYWIVGWFLLCLGILLGLIDVCFKSKEYRN